MESIVIIYVCNGEVGYSVLCFILSHFRCAGSECRDEESPAWLKKPFLLGLRPEVEGYWLSPRKRGEEEEEGE